MNVKNESAEFYRGLAENYDAMTRFQQRLPGERAMLSGWRELWQFDRALDTACGTGLHAIALAQLGVNVTAADLSPEMLAQARENATTAGVTIHWAEAAMEGLGPAVAGPFDLILCLGNSLPHLLDDQALAAAFAGFHRLLTPGGHLLLQLINYEPVLAAQRRIVALNREGEREFIRFYDFGAELLRFNILEIDWLQQPPAHRLGSVPLNPWRLAGLQPALTAAGFGAISLYGDMQRTDFDPLGSPNLVIAAVA